MLIVVVRWLETSGHRRALQLHLSLIASIKTQAGFFPGVFSSPKVTVHLVASSTEASGSSNSLDESASEFIKLSFRSRSSMDGGRDAFIQHMRKVLDQKKWLTSKATNRAGTVARQSNAPRAFDIRSAGVSGIMTMVKKQTDSEKASVSEAFTDLDGLMKYAEELVKLADRVATLDDENERSEFDALWMSAGIRNPVTKQVAGDRFHRELAKQIGDFVAQQLPEHHGMMSLVDVYVMYNRARGTDMISPDDLAEAVKLFSKLEIPLIVRSFAANPSVRIVQSTQFDSKHMSHQLAQLARERTCISELDVSKDWKMSVPIARHYLELAEELGSLCRDVSIQGVLFFPNFFLESR